MSSLNDLQEENLGIFGAFRRLELELRKQVDLLRAASDRAAAERSGAAANQDLASAWEAREALLSSWLCCAQESLSEVGALYRGTTLDATRSRIEQVTSDGR